MGQDMTVAARRIPNGVAQAAHLAPEHPVAGYVHAATQLEGDSLRKQLEAVLRYARHRGMQLIRIYCDECRGSLRIDNRPGLRQLFRDIECGAGDFGAVLLLDPSRWSRSPDPEHGLVLEDRCKRAGIDVHYCAGDPFGDELPVSTLVRSIERAMVRDYPRKLTESHASARRACEESERRRQVRERRRPPGRAELRARQCGRCRMSRPPTSVAADAMNGKPAPSAPMLVVRARAVDQDNATEPAFGDFTPTPDRASTTRTW